jgi:prepilin-type N-terminal cleavage/methylation domain-containing protein
MISEAHYALVAMPRRLQLQPSSDPLETIRSPAARPDGARVATATGVRSCGFSLVEVVVATAILLVSVASLAQLFVASEEANGLARVTSMGTLLAQSKMEELRGAPGGLTPSPNDALLVNIAGYVDFLDANGTVLNAASDTPSAQTVYVRRWSIGSLPLRPSEILLQVLVTRRSTATGSRMRGDVRLVSLRAPAREGS